MTSFKTFSILFVAIALAAPAFGAEVYSKGQWSDETLDTMSRIAIQDGGRIKPLSTFAKFTLLKLNGKSSLNLDEADRKAKLDPMEWLLDCLFYPEETKDYKHFLADNSEVLTAIGGTPKEQRDRYSYNEIEPRAEKLFELAREYSMIEDKDRTPVQRQILILAHNFNQYQGLIHYLDWARQDFPTMGSRLLERIYPGQEAVGFSDLLSNPAEIQRSVLAIRALNEEQTSEEEAARFLEEENRLYSLLDAVQTTALQREALHIIPPANGEEADWLTPHDMIMALFTPDAQIGESEIAYVAALEDVTQATGSPIAFASAAQELSDLAVRQAKARGEYSKVPWEISFYNKKFFFWAQWLFVLASITVCVSWLFMGSKNLYRAANVAIAIPWVLLVTGIVYRCIIRSRPPISTLYETILFITAAIVIVALFIEYVNRQRIGTAIAAFMGAFGMFLAYKYEMSDKQDTMPSLVAVLDTNFWLSTHVTIVTTGYAAGLLAAAVGIVYILGRFIGFKKDDKAFYKNLSRMVYGIVCFGLLFSFVGTVLGGIWANYSWGRFWGWDPKENGALLIVLANLAMLHARLGGYIRDLGLAMSAVACGMVVAFSWWGVNLLGVGLHSYGFTSGIWGALIVFWISQVVVLFAGSIVFLRERIAKKKGAPPVRGTAAPDLPPQPIAK